MIEPVPQQKLAPVAQPILRVGLILPQDLKRSLTLLSIEHNLEIRTASGTHTVPHAEKIIVRAEGNQVVWENNGTQSSETLSVHLPTIDAPLRGSGIRIDSIIAGRGFHWQKEITGTFLGVCEISAREGALICVNIIPFETYLASVISSEMSGDAPIEFLKAQAVAARSWATVFLGSKHPDMPFTICNDDDCQRYQGTTHLTPAAQAAVEACRGEFLMTTHNCVCAAYYAKSCGGWIDDPQAIFGFPVPGLRAKPDAFDPTSFTGVTLAHSGSLRPWLECSDEWLQQICCSPHAIPENELGRYLGAVDEHSHYFRWQKELPLYELHANMRTLFPGTDLVEITELAVLQRSPSGRVTNLEITYKNSAGLSSQMRLRNQYEIRKTLAKSFLYSSAFDIATSYDSKGKLIKITLSGAGWGHGVGLCQIGALGMALKGHSYREILKHYYPETDLVRCYL